MSEFERRKPSFNPRELEGLAKMVEASPVDPKLAKAEDLRRRIWLALKSPAYKYDDRAELFKAVREKVRERATSKRHEIVTLPPEVAPIPKPMPRHVEPIGPLTKDHKRRLMPGAIANQDSHPADAFDSRAEEAARSPLGE